MSPKEQVLKYYPNAVDIIVNTVNDKTYHYIISQHMELGKGKTSKAAWKAASRNMDI